MPQKSRLKKNLKKFQKILKKGLTNRILFGIIYKSSRERRFADMAQSVEHVIGNDEVISSNLIISSKNPSQ